MAQVKIFASCDTIRAYREALSEGIHQALVQAIKLPLEKKFQRFIPLDPENFLFPADRSANYLIIEIMMFTGRSVEAKKELIRSLYANITGRVPITAMDIEITLIESPMENWGIRGRNGDELQLNYNVKV